MAFLDALGKTISEKGKDAAKKAKDLTETMQMKLQINSEEGNLKQAYQDAGKLAYDSGLTAQTDDYAEIFRRIEEAKARIAGLEEQICRVEGVQICPECGAKNPAGAAFCSSCGSRINGEQEEIPDTLKPAVVTEEKICPECGAVCDHDSRFCMTCGHAF